MRFVLTALKLVAGFVLACCVAGLTQVAFIVTPFEIARLSGDERLSRLGGAALLILFAIYDTLVFAAPLAAIAIAYAVGHRVRRWGYFVAVGAGIALFAAIALAAGEHGFPGAYACTAYLVSGALGGAVFALTTTRWKAARR